MRFDPKRDAYFPQSDTRPSWCRPNSGAAEKRGAGAEKKNDDFTISPVRSQLAGIVGALAGSLPGSPPANGEGARGVRGNVFRAAWGTRNAAQGSRAAYG